VAMHREGDKVKSPGVKYKHYRAKCETALFESEDIEGVKRAYKEALDSGKVPYVMCANSYVEAFKGMNLLLLGSTEEEIASNLYDKLLEGEKKASIIIAVAMPNELGVNMGIMNRLKKSCG